MTVPGFSLNQFLRACFLLFLVYPVGAAGLIALPNGHSLAPLFNRYLQIPGFTAQLPNAGEFFFNPAFSISQGQFNSITAHADGSQSVNVFYDYEAYSLELPLEYGLDSANAIGMNLQVFGYSGGFLDAAIASFHSAFGFPNNSRDKMPNNRLLIDLPSGNGFSLHAESSQLYLADPVLWYSCSVYSDSIMQVSATVLTTLPLGLSGGFGGLQLPQVALAISGAWEPSPFIFLHANAAINVPIETFTTGENHVWPQFQSRTGLMFALVGDFWCGIDFFIRSSPLGSASVALDYGNILNQPAIDLQVSLLWHGREGAGRDGLAAFTIQEDPISHNSSDVSFSATGAFRF